MAETSLIKDEGDIMRCSYLADPPLTTEFEESMRKL
jgi:hypothetical protein